nr:MAG TPA: hypothetical protein [Caudoviricetes sp.]
MQPANPNAIIPDNKIAAILFLMYFLSCVIIT